MLQGETAGIAGAALQRQVNDHVSAAGGQASSFQLLPPRESGGATRLALSFAMRIDIDGLRDVLHAIETGQPLLFVDDIAIRMPDKAAGQSEGDVARPAGGRRAGQRLCAEGRGPIDMADKRLSLLMLAAAGLGALLWWDMQSRPETPDVVAPAGPERASKARLDADRRCRSAHRAARRSTRWQAWTSKACAT